MNLRQLADRLIRIEKRLVETDQRVARMMIPGKVKAVDPEKYRLRLVLATDAESGAEILSPWVKWQSGSAGKVRDWSPPEEGEEMLLLSPSGVIGSGSRAMFGTFDDEHQPPTDKGDERVWAFGSMRMVLKADGLTITVGDAEIALTEGTIALGVGGKGFTIDGSELAMSTLFRGKDGSRPAHYQGGKDSDGDTSTDGNDQVLV
ncbi:hypothetical protein C3941_09430 [Kaistia algarum]|uniref:phage baseplate assembly protein V n=1 Tax=Kaistia algarum TaxID=2083279 RepID=UPI000CE8CDA8|nr:phage baseplate assembly protein V [Kaistia algarum]MCX5512279.1 phage baseplate assembly protein V [Kaistia algarum]PPE80370.1 hypothetical protein C3941_09430 [Kaistia algarum]